MMIVSIADLGAALGKAQAFSFVSSAPELDAIHEEYSLEGPVEVAGTVTNVGSGFRVKGVITCRKSFVCDRCLGQFVEEQKHKFSEDFRREGEAEGENESVNYFSGDAIDIAELVRDTILAAQPLNNICRPDCRGLCPKCGADLNKGDCGCNRTILDPRLAALQQLLKKK